MLDQSRVCIPWDATWGKTGKGSAGGAWEWLGKSRNGCSGSCPSCLSDRGKGELADLPSMSSKIPIKHWSAFQTDPKTERSHSVYPWKKWKKAGIHPHLVQLLILIKKTQQPLGSLLLFCWRVGNVGKSFWEIGGAPRAPACSHPGKLWDIPEKWEKNQESEWSWCYQSCRSGSFEEN